MNATALRRLVLSFENVSEAPHFDRIAFRTPRRIFATMAADGSNLNVKLEPDQQAMVISNIAAFKRVDNKWGDQGWTTCLLKEVTVHDVKPVLSEAHAAANVPAPKSARKKR